MKKKCLCVQNKMKATIDIFDEALKKKMLCIFDTPNKQWEDQ